MLLEIYDLQAISWMFSTLNSLVVCVVLEAKSNVILMEVVLLTD